MNTKKATGLLIVALLCGTGISQADFKYTESAKITGGMVATMMKVAGAFSKQAREPIVTTHYVKGNRMRTDHSDGRVDVLDIDGRRSISIDTQKKTYSVATFEEMKAALEQAQQKMREKGAKLSPKFEVTPTGNTKVILGQATREVRVKIEMQMEGEDPKTHQAQSMTMTVTSNMWIAPSVRGYDEMRRFYERMGKEMNWQPGAIFGGDPNLAQAMSELRKNAATLEGMPLVQNASIGMAGATLPPEEHAHGAATPEAGATQTAGEKVASPGGAIKKGLGGLFGGFGRKKKQEQQEQPAAAPGPPAPSGTPSLADVTTEVTAFSTDLLDSSLFEVPAGYRQVPSDVDKLLGVKR